MAFITGLPDSEGHNAICTLVDNLTRERHYIACTAIDEGTSAESTADVLLHGVFIMTYLPPSRLIEDPNSWRFAD